LIVGANPRQLQFEFSLWTRDIVRELIRREFGVALSAVSVGRLLRAIGLSPQRPLFRAYQQGPEAVERWKTQEYPAIRAEAKKAAATIYFADEASIRSYYHAGTTWAPVGRTPVVRTTRTAGSPPAAAPRGCRTADRRSPVSPGCAACSPACPPRRRSLCAASGRTVSDLLNQCSRHTTADTIPSAINSSDPPAGARSVNRTLDPVPRSAHLPAA
jgi:hypothetical protein